MRKFRRLPPLLRVVSILGLLLPFAAIELLVVSFAPFLLSSMPVGLYRVLMIALDLFLLSMACSFAVRTYSMRFDQPDGGQFPLSSWQSQVWAIALLSALPLCGIALAVVIPPTSRTFDLVFPITILAAFVLLAANLWKIASTESSGPTRTPPTG